MSIRRTLQIGFGVIILATVFIGFVAYVTLYQVQVALSPPADTVASLFTRGQSIIAVATVLGILGCLGIGIYLIRAVTRPLAELTEAVRELDSEGLRRGVPVDRDDEFGSLAQALNRMSDSISRRTVSRTYLNNILDSMAEMLFVTDGEGLIRRVNRAAQHQLGYPASTLEGMTMDRLLVDGPLFSHDERITFQRQGFVDHAERSLRTQDGDTLPVLFSRSRVTDETGSAQGIVCVAQDITERKRAEERIRASLREKEVLLREIHHRVKNNLQVISSLLHLQSKHVEDDDARALFAESQSRIRSMALIHERLYQSDDLAQVDFAAYLEGLTEHLFRSYNVRSDTVTLQLDTDAGPLSVDRAIPCGLIVNELVSNAIKHAFPDDRAGTIRVAYMQNDREARLVVADDGVGAPEDFDAEQSDSLGLRLVRGLVQQLNGALTLPSPSRSRAQNRLLPHEPLPPHSHRGRRSHRGDGDPGPPR